MRKSAVLRHTALQPLVPFCSSIHAVLHCSLAVLSVAFVIVGVLISDASAGVAGNTSATTTIQLSRARATARAPTAPRAQRTRCVGDSWTTPRAAVQNTCDLTITVEKDMKKPVYFYYEL